ncbi:MAG TPA: CHAT domain-containing protein [Pyrinomonadaceae bacterium]|nr:CHAT domain-containing protein [Pyrinomonadaceae bacterium]
MNRLLLPAVLFLLTSVISAYPKPQTQTEDVITPEPGRQIEREISGAELHAYKLKLPAGGYANLQVDQRGISVSLSIFVDGQQLRFIDNLGTGEPERFSLVAANATEYRIEVRTSDKLQPRAKYVLIVKDAHPATDQDKARVEAEVLVEEGMQLFYQQTKEKKREAIEKFQRAVTCWQKAGDKEREARMFHLMGHIYNGLGESQKAEELATQALPIARAAGDPSAEAWLLDTIGTSYNERGDRAKALEFFNRALRLRSADDPVGRVNTLNNIGMSHAWIGDRIRGLEYLHQAETTLRELGDRSRRASVLTSICVVYKDMSEHKKALDYCSQSLQIKREVGDSAGEAVSLNNIAGVYAAAGQYQQALDAYLQSRDIHKKLGHLDGEGITLNNVGWVYAMIGDPEKAIDFYNQALVPLRAIKYDAGVAMTLSNIGVSYADMKEFRKALDIHLQVLPMRPEKNDRDGRANTLNNIGGCYQNLGDTAKALEFYTQALALHRTLDNRRQIAGTLRNLGTLYRDTGDTAKALEFLTESREIFRAIGERQGEALTLSHLAKLERDRGNLIEAHKLIEEAIAATESLRVNLKSQALRAALLSASRNYFEFDIEVLMRLHKQRPADGYDAAALQVSEKGRARSLLEMLREARAEIRQGVDPALIQREKELRSTIAGRADRQTRMLNGKFVEEQAAAAARELDALTLEYEQLQARIRDTSPRYAALTQPVPLNLSEIQKQVLDENTLLLEYALGDEKSFVWAVTPGSIKSFELPAKQKVEQAAQRFYQLLTERGRAVTGESLDQRQKRLDQAEAEYAQAAKALSEILLAPVAGELQSKRLLIVGEGILQYVPFAALPLPPGNSPLIVRHEIVSLPSASVLAVLRNETENRKPASRNVAVLADPVFSASDSRLAVANKAHSTPVTDEPGETQRSASESGVADLTRLRFSRQEADEISRLAGEKRNLKALDFAASRSVAMSDQLRDYRIVHFATHGLINNQNPDLSGIVLSLVDEQGRPQNGFLRLYDIYNLKLEADLVVLSACQTALGKEIKGEGLVGLTRGFMYAGAPRVVASYWRIDDRATADMMKRFYTAMLKDGLRPAAALRAAQVSMLQDKRWQSPHYWAAFTIQGEWR